LNDEQIVSKLINALKINIIYNSYEAMVKVWENSLRQGKRTRKRLPEHVRAAAFWLAVLPAWNDLCIIPIPHSDLRAVWNGERMV